MDRHGFRDNDEADLKEKMAKESAEMALREEYMAKIQALIQKRRGNKWDEFHEMEEAALEGSGDEEMDSEEGEQEMEEGEMEEEEDEFVSDDEAAVEKDDEGDEIPAAIPIAADTVGINNATKEESSEVSDIDVDDYGSSSDEYDSDELDNHTTENPHGFVYGNMLETFSKSKKDRLEEMREARDAEALKAHRDKFKKKRNTKKIGKSEKVHQKNKPFMMVKQKKIRDLKDQMKPLNQRKDRTKRFIGHFSKR